MINSCLALYERLDEVRIQGGRLGRSFPKPTKETFSPQFYTIRKTTFALKGHFVNQFFVTAVL